MLHVQHHRTYMLADITPNRISVVPIARPTASAPASDTAAFIAQLNARYEEVHRSFEDNFWATKMNLKGCSTEALSRTKTEYENFLGDAANLAAVRAKLKVSS